MEANLVDVSWYLIIGLTCMPPIIRDVEHYFFICQIKNLTDLSDRLEISLRISIYSNLWGWEF